MSMQHEPRTDVAAAPTSSNSRAAPAAASPRTFRVTCSLRSNTHRAPHKASTFLQEGAAREHRCTAQTAAHGGALRRRLTAGLPSSRQRSRRFPSLVVCSAAAVTQTNSWWCAALLTWLRALPLLAGLATPATPCRIEASLRAAALVMSSRGCCSSAGRENPCTRTSASTKICWSIAAKCGNRCVVASKVIANIPAKPSPLPLRARRAQHSRRGAEVL